MPFRVRNTRLGLNFLERSLKEAESDWKWPRKKPGEIYVSAERKFESATIGKLVGGTIS